MRRLEAVLPRELKALVSPRVGIVTAIEECLVDVDEPPLIRIACEVAAGDEVLGIDLGSAHNVGGSGMSQEHALGAAIGEAVERYSAAHVPRERIVHAAAAELGPRAVDPAEFGLFADSQYARPGFRYVRFTKKTRLPWVDGVDLATGESVWLPAELVFLAAVGADDAPRIAYSTSSGLACGTSFDEALERALFELLERDAFMIAWWRRVSPPRLDWSSDPWMRAIDRRYFQPTGLQYSALDLSWVHELPIVAAVVRAPGSGAALGVGAAANSTVAQAWWRALAEAFASRSACRKLRLLEPGHRYADNGSDVLSFDDHIRFYGDDERAEQASFLWSATRSRSVEVVPAVTGGVEERRSALLARIGRTGSRAFAVDVTAPDVAEAGLHVIRAVTPGLCQLDASHDCRFLGGPRLLQLDLSERDTLTGAVRTIDDLNQLPHPFP